MTDFAGFPDRLIDDGKTARAAVNGMIAEARIARRCLDRIRAICEDGERSGADRLDEIHRIVTGERKILKEMLEDEDA